MSKYDILNSGVPLSLDKTKNYVKNADGSVTEIVDLANLAIDEVGFIGHKSHLHKILLADRNISVLDEKKQNLLPQGTEGQLLTSVGGSWIAQDAPITLPAQSGQSGKYLTTDGTSASWNTLDVTGQINTAVAALVDTAPSTLDTLNELAAALGDDPNFATSITTQIGVKWTQDNTKISHWDSAYSWGNHANAGYLNYSMLSDGTGHGFKVGQHLSYYSFQTEGTTSGIYFNDSFGFLKANYVPILQWDQNKVTIKNSSYTDTITLNGSSGALTAISFIGDGTQLTGVAKSATTYTKTEVDTSLSSKADITTVDTSLALKADQSTTYTKTQVDTSLALKADQSTTYTKTQVDTSLGLKLNNAGGTMTGQLNMTAHIIPTAGATYDLGSSTVGWRNVYTNDLHLSNEGHDEGNSVDGTRGNWTIQEGSENLYIINNKSGKKYKFALEEIL